MKKMFGVLAVFLCLVMTVSIAAAVEVNRFDWAFNVDGTLYEFFEGDAMPGTNNFNSSGFGTLELKVSGVGTHSVLGFFDFEIDEATNTFYNEYANVRNSIAAGQSYEIDEPGYEFGDIYFNLLAGVLDNTNAIYADGGVDDDVSFALGWNFTLLADEIATLTFTLTERQPFSGIFYLTQSDADSMYSLYYFSELQIGGGGQAIVPEPSSYLLFVVGLVGLIGCRRKLTGKKN